MNEITTRNTIGAHFRIDPVEKAYTLPPEQKAADDRCEKHHSEGRPDADLPANDDERRDFGHRHDEQQKRNNGKSLCFGVRNRPGPCIQQCEIE